MVLTKPHRSLFVFLGLALAVGCSDGSADAGAGTDAAQEPTPDSGSAAATPIGIDAPLEDWQAELIQLAFRTVQGMPDEPHVRNRCRVQEQAALAALELDQDATLLELSAKITNWRRGSLHADLALKRVRADAGADVDALLKSALLVADAQDDWRGDRIRSKVAQVHAWRGEVEAALELEAGIGAADQGGVALARALQATGDEFEERLGELEAQVALEDFDLARGALTAAVALHESFYDDPERRGRIEHLVETGYPKLPADVRIVLLGSLADTAIEKGDGAHALDLVGRASILLDSKVWTAEHEVPALARLAALRHRAGEPLLAQSDLQAALAIYEQGIETIADVFRANTLRPVAEAYADMGDEAKAREMYMRALEAGHTNPNGRPRADDFTATCTSLARHGVRPTNEQLERIRAMHGEIGAPW